MITFGNGGVILPVKNGLKHQIRGSLKGGRASGSQDYDYCDSVPTTKADADGTNDLSGVLTAITSPPPSPECLTSFVNELPWPYFSPSVVHDDDDGGAEWVCVDKVTEPNPFSLYDGYVFGSVPSDDEVQAALTSLQGVLDQVPSVNGVEESDCDIEEGRPVTDEQSDCTTDSSSVTQIGSISDWIEPSMQICYSNRADMLPQRRGYDRVYDALYMLQNEPMVQKMVASLSSDSAVWNAVLNNTVVQEIRESLSKVVAKSSVPSDDSESKPGNFLSSFVAGLKAKIEGLIKSLRMMMISFIHRGGSDQSTRESGDGAELRLRVSFMLTMIVFLVVVLKRMNNKP